MKKVKKPSNKNFSNFIRSQFNYPRELEKYLQLLATKQLLSVDPEKHTYKQGLEDMFILLLQKRETIHKLLIKFYKTDEETK